MEEIQASTDLTGKIASANALKEVASILGVPDYSKALLFTDSTSAIDFQFVAPSNGIFLGSGYGTSQSTSYLHFKVNNVNIYNQGNSDEWICNFLPLAKGDELYVKGCLSTRNLGLYFVPYK